MQNDSDIGISCIFAKGSTARGCYILIFKDTVVVSGTVATVANSAVEMAPNSAEHLITGLTTGTYNILVFDVESDGSFNPSRRPAFSAVANIISKLVSTETTGKNSYILSALDYTLHTAIYITHVNFVAGTHIREYEPQCDATAKGRLSRML